MPRINRKLVRANMAIKEGKIYSSPIDVRKTFCAIAFPKSILEHLKIKNESEVSWVFVDGVVQLVGPSSLTLPIISITQDHFEPQPA